MLPYWGDIKLAQETIDSVLAQTSDDWHLTILDDHYESKESAKYFKELKHPKITYIRHPKNLGITKNFNYAAQNAKAEFCTIIGCDDRMLPNYVEQALEHIGKASFYQPSVEIIDAEGKTHLPLADRVKSWLRPKKSGIYSGEKLAASLCHGNWLYFPSIMWRTKTLQKYPFDERLKVVQDLTMELNMILDGAKLYLDNSAKSFQYRRFDESLSSKEKTGIRFDEEKVVYEKFAQKFQKVGWKKAARAAKLRISSQIHQLMSK